MSVLELGLRPGTGADIAERVLRQAAEEQPELEAIRPWLIAEFPRFQNTYGCSVRWDSSGAERRGVVGCTAWNPRASGRCSSGWPSTSRRGMTGWIGSMPTSRSYNNKESGSDT